MRLIQFSIVVAGRLHNPTILNPDFLQINGIVPKEWDWVLARPVMTTPALAVVQYKNGTSITVEPAKLQVADTHDPSASKVELIARQYVATLPHVHYTGVGINFQSVVEIPDPESYLKANFLKGGPWDSKAVPLTAVGLRLAYPLDGGGRLVLSLDAGEVELFEGNEKRKVAGVISNANFHRDVKAPPSEKEILVHLEYVKGAWGKYQELLRTALGGKV